MKKKFRIIERNWSDNAKDYEVQYRFNITPFWWKHVLYHDSLQAAQDQVKRLEARQRFIIKKKVIDLNLTPKEFRSLSKENQSQAVDITNV
jgi:hypothetical protein